MNQLNLTRGQKVAIGDYLRSELSGRGATRVRFRDGHVHVHVAKRPNSFGRGWMYVGPDHYVARLARVEIQHGN